MTRKILCYFIFMICLSIGTTVYGEAGAKDGVINLETVRDGRIPLNGEWEFYWKQLILPNEFERIDQKPMYLSVPGSWKDENVKRVGYGTYRLKMKIPETDVGTQKALSLNYIGSAYRLWINGEEYEGLGTVGITKSEETPQLQQNLIFFEPTESQLEIVIQVSNFSFREGGIIHKIEYGEQTPLFRSYSIDLSSRLLIIGGFIVFGLYLLIIFATRKNEQTFLYTGLASLAIGIRMLMVTEYIVYLFIPNISWELMIRIEYLSELVFFIAMVLLINKLYEHEVHRVMVLLSLSIVSILAVVVIFTPTEFFSNMLPYHIYVLVLIGTYFLFYVGVMAVIRKREGAILNLVGACGILFASINDTFVSVLIVDEIDVISYAFIIFIILQAVIISKRYSRLLKENVSLTQELLDLNQSLEERIAERTKKLNEKNIELEDLQQERTRLLANIAHDIGTPIVGIQTYLQIAKEGKISIDFQSVLPQILDKLSYIQKLNKDLFELSKLESQKLIFQLEKIKMKEFFQKLYQSIEAEYRMDAKIQLGKFETVIEGKEIYVRIDKFRIEQVMQNYVVNAIKFNSSQEKIITLHCYPQLHDDRNEVIIVVEDNGEGIGDQELKQIFERFYKKSEGNREGSGLGLAIAKEIIEQHEGRVGATSILKQGSRFYFTLPLFLE